MENKKMILLASLTMSTALFNIGCGQQIAGSYQVQVTESLPGTTSATTSTGTLTLTSNGSSGGGNPVTGTLMATGTYGTLNLTINGTENGNAGQVTGQATMTSSGSSYSPYGAVSPMGGITNMGVMGTNTSLCGPLTVNMTVTSSNGQHQVNGTATGSAMNGMIGTCSITFNGSRPN